MHTTLTGPGRTRHNSLPPAFTPVHPESAACLRTIPPIMNGARIPTEQIFEIITRGDGVMTRVRMVNATLRHYRVDCSELDTLAEAGRIQLAAAQEMVQSGNRTGTRAALIQFRLTVTSLRDTYREILIREDLPGDTAHGVLSVAQSLDVTAIKAGLA